MVEFGLTMQGRKEEIPAEIADWIEARAREYPQIDFKIDCMPASGTTVEEVRLYEDQCRKYSRTYILNGPTGGVGQVVFPYLNEAWVVKITGGLDRDGKIVGWNEREKTESPLTAEMRNAIAGISDASNLEKLNEKALALRRLEGELARAAPNDFRELVPHASWKSEVTMSGTEFKTLANGPDTKDELEEALNSKDWGKVRQLQKKNLN